MRPHEKSDPPVVKYPRLVASIVTYNSVPKVLTRAVQSILDTALNIKLYIVDNSPNTALESLCSDPRIVYRHVGRNIGFGAAHNLAIREAGGTARYHLIANPDIYFDAGTMEELITFLDLHPEAGAVMPKVLSPDGEIQRLCKRLPSPFDLCARRFFPSAATRLFSGRMTRYEMRDNDYASILRVPALSGCFMVLRTEALLRVGGFDEKFFLYLEDYDLSRRIQRHFGTYYYPHVAIRHEHARESYRDFKLLLHHVRSAIHYFNKWGWIFDDGRRRLNELAGAVPVSSPAALSVGRG